MAVGIHRTWPKRKDLQAWCLFAHLQQCCLRLAFDATKKRCELSRFQCSTLARDVDEFEVVGKAAECFGSFERVVFCDLDIFILVNLCLRNSKGPNNSICAFQLLEKLRRI